MNNLTFILLGATGDLSKRSIIPALYQLLLNNKLDNVVIVGAALEDITPEAILQNSKQFIKDIDEATWKKLASIFYYMPMDFTNTQDYKKLKKFIEEHELVPEGNRLIYLATPPQFFCPITEHVCNANIIKRSSDLSKNRWHRIVYEKPFGSDQKTAHEINECIAEYINEKQVYRIDHYLAKEIIGNIALLRFTNRVFEPLWNNKNIDYIEIILDESLTIEQRGRYYDVYGALKDVVQNHMLQILSLIAMEAPKELSGEDIRDAKAKVLHAVKPVGGFLGQYEEYKNEIDVAPDSTTETFAVLELHIDNPRWQGVPFYLKTGKALDNKETMVHVVFKDVECLLRETCPSERNSLTIRVVPESGFDLVINVKKPGFKMEVTPVNMKFCYECYFGPETIDGYQLLIEEILKGEQSAGVRFDEIEDAWRIVDAIAAMNLPLYSYKKGSNGPKELDEYSRTQKIRWIA